MSRTTVIGQLRPDAVNIEIPSASSVASLEFPPAARSAVEPLPARYHLGRVAMLLSITLIVGYISCRPKGTLSSSGQARPEGSDALIIVDGAEGVKFSDESGGLVMTYSLRTPYPAPGFVGEIGPRLVDMGWNPQEESYFNPGQSTSHVRGWQDYIDGTVEPEKQVHQWWGEWLDEDGSLLIYILEYRDPVDDAQHSPVLQVRALLTTAPTAPPRGLESGSDPSDFDRVLGIAQQYRRAWLAQDWQSMDQLLDPLWTLTDWEGRVREKKDVFGPDDLLVISSWEENDVAHRHFGHAAVLSGRRMVRLQNRAESLQLHFTDFFAKQYGEWHLVASHLTLMAKSNR